jgi:hypothetical protein
MLPELTEASYLSRFFAKFVEILAGGLATTMCAYLIAYLGAPLSSPTAVPAAGSPVSVASKVAASVVNQPAPPVAASAIDEHRAPQPGSDAPPAQPARKAEKAGMAVPASKDIRPSTNPARSERSAEALARAALANLAADPPAPADVPIRRVLAGVGSLPSAPADFPSRQSDLQTAPTAIEGQLGRVAAVDPGSPPEIAAPESQADQHQGLFSFFKRMPGLLRFGTPSVAGEAPRPPMPVGTASRDK